MAKVKVTVGMYISNDIYSSTEVISVEEFNEKVQHYAKRYKDDETEFLTWLEDNYDIEDIWKATEEERQEIKAKYNDRCQTVAEENVAEDWEYHEIETEVELSTCPCVSK